MAAAEAAVLLARSSLIATSARTSLACFLLDSCSAYEHGICVCDAHRYLVDQ
ncbi:hypothetical protein [Streptomyces sp. SA3_actF]|uniref:hypothetical protein n=1 Tax=Streptomyces sp. SA3_actF TaxID=682181 RepID=UPI0002F5C5B8|nr:hypothetical protein [Streptomyces sp. SA3_actF]